MALVERLLHETHVHHILAMHEPDGQDDHADDREGDEDMAQPAPGPRAVMFPGIVPYFLAAEIKPSRIASQKILKNGSPGLIR
jgi:hypothetical protein